MLRQDSSSKLSKAKPWKSLLESLPLSAKEKKIAESFLEKPDSRLFLAISDIFKAHNLPDESLEILTVGVGRHSLFTAARVALAREYFQCGMISDAWSTLRFADPHLKSNSMALRLTFQLAILMDAASIASEMLSILRQQRLISQDLEFIAQIFEREGLISAKKILLGELAKNGMKVILPSTPLLNSRTSGGADDLAQKSREFDCNGFFVASLKDAFYSKGIFDDVELHLDKPSPTLAEIYFKQGHYLKSLEIYKALALESPQYEQWKTMQDLCARKHEEQSTRDHMHAEMSDGIVKEQLLDYKIGLMQNLLSRIDRVYTQQS